MKPLIDPLLPKEQVGFRQRKSTVNQVVLLIIEDTFEAKKKAGVVFSIRQQFVTLSGIDEASSGQEHGHNHHVTCPKLRFHSYYR